MNDPTRTDSATTLLLLGDDDDVLIATRDLAPGRNRASDGSEIDVREPIRLGHKVARRPLPVGTRVLRCGVPIGSMTADAERGAWVHVHNLGSDYIATFSRRGGAS
jgi:hypothetical protein